MSEHTKQLDLERIQGIIVERLCRHDDKRFHITANESPDALMVDIHGKTSRGPALDLGDLKDIQNILIGGDTPEDDWNLNITAGERPADGWSYIRVWVDKAYLKSDILAKTEK